MTPSAKRLLFLSLCFAIASSACSKKEAKGVQIPALQLVPSQADVVIGLDVDAVRKSALADPLWGAMQADADLGGFLKAFKSCRPKLGKLSLTGATRMETEGDEFMVVIEGQGVGDEDLLKCVERGFAEASGEPAGMLLFTTRGDVRMAPQEDGGWAILLNKDALAFVSKGWEKFVFAIIDAHNKPKKADRKTWELSKDILRSDVWAAFRVAGMPKEDLKDLPEAEGLSDFIIWLDLSAGLALKADLVFAEKAQAAAFNTSTQPLIAEAKLEVKAEAVANQFPTQVIDSFKLGPSPRGDNRLQAELTIGKKELPLLLGMAMAAMQ